MERYRKSLGFVCLTGVALFAAAGANRARADNGHIPDREAFDFSILGSVAVQNGGVEKSLYTFAKEFVSEVAGKPDFGGREPIENLLSMAYEPHLWLRQPFLRVRFPALKEMFDSKHGRISPLELEDHREFWEPLLEDNREINREVNALFRLTYRIVGRDDPEFPINPIHDEIRLAPRVNFRGEKDQWITADELSRQVKNKSPEEEKLIGAYFRVREAFIANDAATFNASSHEVAAAAAALELPIYGPRWKFKLNRWEARVGLFRIAGWAYLLSMLIFATSYLIGRKIYWIAASSTLGLGVAIHIAALVVRGILAGRTPVANLFESAVFITMAVTVFSLVISLYYRAQVVGLGGATLGFFFMGMANNMPLEYGRKIVPLIDALQSYWLRIHVTSMLISYAFFAVAAFVALAYVGRYVLMRRRPGFDAAGDAALRYLDSLNFRIITIGVPILTGGVILGAVWAAEAWGRPWGFDPKETAAAMTWMVYVLYLHTRLFMGWRGMRCIMVSLLGFTAVVFTYLGVSFFLPGLHSYVSEDGVGFTEFLRKIIPGI